MLDVFKDVREKHADGLEESIDPGPEKALPSMRLTMGKYSRRRILRDAPHPHVKKEAVLPAPARQGHGKRTTIGTINPAGRSNSSDSLERSGFVTRPLTATRKIKPIAIADVHETPNCANRGVRET